VVDRAKWATRLESAGDSGINHLAREPEKSRQQSYGRERLTELVGMRENSVYADKGQERGWGGGCERGRV
jgi:hypothetical protein